jgi:ABC-type multidrug transport system fused ATPase/permease subunit
MKKLSEWGTSCPSDPTQPFGIKHLARLLRVTLGRHVWDLVGWTSIMACVYLLGFIPPMILGSLINVLTGSESSQAWYSVYLVCAAFAAVGTCEALMRVLAKPALARLGYEAAQTIKSRAFDNLLHRSIEWHHEELTGNRVQRLSNGGTAIVRLMDQIHSNVMPVCITFACVLTSFLFYGGSYLLYAVLYSTSFWGIQAYFVSREKALLYAAQRANEEVAGKYSEAAGNILTIKTLNAEKEIARAIAAREQAAHELMIAQKQLSFRKYGFFNAFDGVAYGGFALLVAQAALRGAIAPGLVVVLLAYFKSLTSAIRDTVSFFDSFVENWISVGRIAPLVLDDSEPHRGTDLFPAEWDAIRLEDVSTSYRNGQGGLKGINLTIRRGERVGIVGGSGAGKTTLAKLLMGTIAPAHGRFTIGMRDVREIAAREYTQHISTVLQETEIFHLSVKDNVTLLRDVPLPHIMQAIEIAALVPVIAALDDGLNHMLGEKGQRLSGGERQRIGIARAICRAPQVLILDEATSQLDAVTEGAVLRGLTVRDGGGCLEAAESRETAGSELLKQCRQMTLVVVAHRLSTLMEMDRIVVMENGRIVEEGAPQSLLGDPDSRFASMWQAQMKGE